ncbi:MAG: AAA family ATPase [Pseudobdellovibrionaceae bacterium]
MKHDLLLCPQCTHNLTGLPQLIVLTGGPGAGKTAALEFMKKLLCEHIAILPEAASVLFGGGFWRLESNSAKKAAQRAIFHVQQEMQNLFIAEKKWNVGLCDRGTLDGLAYWPGSQSEFFHSIHSDFEGEYAKYFAVIHMRSPTIQNGYNHENPIRIETAERAAVIDEEIYEIWKNHPNYYVIDSSESFLEKIDKTVSLIRTLVSEQKKD